MAERPVASWSHAEKLEAVLRAAAARLPGDVAQALLAMISPTALASMLAILTVWASAHFFGAGEMADIVLITVGWIALGGVALEAGFELIRFGRRTLVAVSQPDIDQAGQHLARAISLIGVQAVLAILTKKPNTFRSPYTRTPGMAPYSKMGKLPKQPGQFYKPKIKFTKSKTAGAASTDAAGDVAIGRDHYGNAKGASEAIRLAVFHEKVHQLLTPRLQIFREFRVYLKQSGYRNSYILRYLEEALAETYAQLRVHGLGKEQFLTGLKFPLGARYEVSIVALGEEARGILLGPITIAGMVFNVFEGERTEEYERVAQPTP